MRVQGVTVATCGRDFAISEGLCGNQVRNEDICNGRAICMEETAQGTVYVVGKHQRPDELVRWAGERDDAKRQLSSRSALRCHGPSRLPPGKGEGQLSEQRLE